MFATLHAATNDVNYSKCYTFRSIEHNVDCRLIAELWMRKFVKNYTYLTDLLTRLGDLNTVLDRSKFHPRNIDNNVKQSYR